MSNTDLSEFGHKRVNKCEHYSKNKITLVNCKCKMAKSKILIRYIFFSMYNISIKQTPISRGISME